MHPFKKVLNIPTHPSPCNSPKANKLLGDARIDFHFIHLTQQISEENLHLEDKCGAKNPFKLVLLTKLEFSFISTGSYMNELQEMLRFGQSSRMQIGK